MASRSPGAPAPLLIGETPLIGHRFIELARPAEDAAEALLTAKTCCFVVPVPSPPVRRHIEAERRRRSARPRNAQEREDAPPQVLEALWHELWQAAVALGLTAAAPAGYDPELYQRVYCHVLRHRRVVVLPITQILPTAAFSVYDYTVPVSFLRPTPQTAAAWIAQVERQYAEDTPLAQVVASWYQL
ncbi:MAG: hypothetical protein KatS3mg131_1562 [Candidatus Tectimicrobiota bacterium]|nr:MAG: hypothetical protein KatS3mg131_1562 [Candidatus Tectomicrobia bacterium]